MKKFLFVLLFAGGGALSSFGQQALSHQPKQNSFNPSVTGGSFDINKNNKQRGITEHINVNYSIYPVPFTDVLNLALSTANPLLFSADIVDLNGNKVAHWQPSVKKYSYTEAIDISSLAPGNYKINIYSEIGEGVVHSISFQKEKKQ
jgi:hypothetical protein